MTSAVSSGAETSMDEMNTIITVRVAEPFAEMVTDRMWQWGVRAVGEHDAVDGIVQVFTSVGNDRDAIRRALDSLDPDWHVEVTKVDSRVDQVPAEYLSPTWFRPDMVCVPAALTPFEFDAGVHVTVIDPGAAFGLGDHPTTRASMALLASLLRTDDQRTGPCSSLLDVGCGTGALAILAAQLGVPTVRAIDIADAAVEATHRNMELNGIVGAIDVDTTPVAELAGGYDVIVANILAPTLIAMADDLKRLLDPGGSLIVSGILAERHDHVLAALAPLRPCETSVFGEWIAITLR